MMEIQKQEYPIKEGLERLLNVLKAQRLVALSGVNRTTISNNLNGKMRMEQPNIDKINAALQQVGEQLMMMRIRRESWQEDCKAIGECVKLKTLVEEIPGMSTTWYGHYMSAKSDFYYGKFSDEDLRRINERLLQFAMQVLQTRLVRL